MLFGGRVAAAELNPQHDAGHLAEVGFGESGDTLHLHIIEIGAVVTGPQCLHLHGGSAAKSVGGGQSHAGIFPVDLPIIDIVDGIKGHQSVVEGQWEGIALRLLHIGDAGIQRFQIIDMLIAGIHPHIVHQYRDAAPIIKEHDGHGIILREIHHALGMIHIAVVGTRHGDGFALRRPEGQEQIPVKIAGQINAQIPAVQRHRLSGKIVACGALAEAGTLTDAGLGGRDAEAVFSLSVSAIQLQAQHNAGCIGKCGFGEALHRRHLRLVEIGTVIPRTHRLHQDRCRAAKRRLAGQPHAAAVFMGLPVIHIVDSVKGRNPVIEQERERIAVRLLHIGDPGIAGLQEVNMLVAGIHLQIIQIQAGTAPVILKHRLQVVVLGKIHHALRMIHITVIGSCHRYGLALGRPEGQEQIPVKIAGQLNAQIAIRQRDGLPGQIISGGALAEMGWPADAGLGGAQCKILHGIFIAARQLDAQHNAGHRREIRLRKILHAVHRSGTQVNAVAVFLRLPHLQR